MRTLGAGMAEFFEMPQASPTMEVGTILSWKKREGDKLAPQDILAEVETDKAAMEVEVFDEGYLLKLLAEEGEEVPAGQPIAILGKSPDEDVSGLVAEFERRKAAQGRPHKAAAPSEPAAPAAPSPKEEAPSAASPGEPAGLLPFTWHGRPIDPAIMEFPLGFSVEPAALPRGRVRAAPAARRVARELHVDLTRVRGTGPHGRVLRTDVEQAARRAPAAEVSADQRIRLSQMRKTIARRLEESWLDAPVFYLTANFACDALVAFRSQLKAAGVDVTYNDILIKACARALRDVPEVNASWADGAIIRHGAVDVGMAVAMEDGLIVPVVRNADQKSLATIAIEARDLAERGRARKLAPEEYGGSTFSVSNLGMMQIEQFTAILNPPEACILAVGALQREPIVDADGRLAAAWRMRATLTCDHRVVDGALGARFLQALRRYLENPALLAA